MHLQKEEEDSRNNSTLALVFRGEEEKELKNNNKEKKKMSMEGKVMVKDYCRKRKKKSHKSLVPVIKKKTFSGEVR